MERRLVVVTSFVAFAIVLTTDVLYVAVINSQGSPDAMIYAPRFVASYLAVLAAIILVALLPRHEVVQIRVPLRATAAAGLLVAGFVGAFSIGLPLVASGVLMTVALTRTARIAGSWWWRSSGLVAAVLAVVVFAAGIEITSKIIVCPETGTSGGGGTDLLTGPYHYECNNGHLDYRSG